MNTCPICSSDNISISHEDVDAREFGLPSGVLRNVSVTACADCGESFRSLPAQGRILAEYRRELVNVGRPLSGDEFAFLRRTLGVTGRGYADAIGTTNVTISRAENSEEVPILQDGLLRAITLLDIAGCKPLEEMGRRTDDEVAIDVSTFGRRRLDLTDGWQTFADQPAYCGKVVPIRPKQTPAVELEIFDQFERAVNDADVLGAVACQ